jgi:bifunctional non-homologous end joining protein LigD
MKHMKCKKDNHRGVPEGDYLYEVKYDGIRAWLVWDKGALKILSKSNADISRKFPELMDEISQRSILPYSARFDCELVCFDEKGIPDFGAITSRFHLGSQAGWDQGAIDNPVTAAIFDIVELNGKNVEAKELIKRKALLGGCLIDEEPFIVTKTYRNGQRLYNRERKRGAEGIIAKLLGTTYQPGRRLRSWLKVKIMYREEVEVYGFTAGLGKRDALFGSLLFRGLDGRPAGKVGTGFTDAELKSMLDFLDTRDPVFQIDGRSTDTFLIGKPFRAIVEGMKKNKSGAIREPVFIRQID